MQFFDLYCAELAYFAEIVSAEIYKHIVFGKLFFVLQKIFLKSLVLFVRLSSWACSCKGEGVEYAVFELYERFGRSGEGFIVRSCR